MLNGFFTKYVAMCHKHNFRREELYEREINLLLALTVLVLKLLRAQLLLYFLLTATGSTTQVYVVYFYCRAVQGSSREILIKKKSHIVFIYIV